LKNVLKAFLYEPPPTGENEESSEVPGYTNPVHVQALRDFVARYPNTEESYEAETWLVFEKSLNDLSRCPGPDNRWKYKRERAANADRLNAIADKANTAATKKLARIMSLADLMQAEKAEEFRRQVEGILGQLKEYESEIDEHFMWYIKFEGTKLSEIEPWLLHLMVINECHAHEFEKAIAVAEDLNQRFADWSKRERFDGQVEMLKAGMTPYPTDEDAKYLPLGRAKSTGQVSHTN
jgi:DNA repair ATPase RecN